MWVWFGNGDGTFQTAVNYTAAIGTGGIAVGDFNGDGKLDLAVVKPFAVEPHPRASAALDAEIIAGEAVAPPPFGGDALGTFGAGDPIEGAPPAEMDRRAVGHFGDGFYQFGAREEAERAGEESGCI